MAGIDWSAAAAWVQAVFSVIAIFAAIWIGRESDRRAHDLVTSERRRQATIVASTVAMQLSFLHRESMSKAVAADESLLSIPKVVTGIKDRDEMLGVFLIGQGSRIESFRDQLLFLDVDSGIRATTAIDALQAHNESTRLTFDIMLQNPLDAESLRDFIVDRRDSLTELAKIMLNAYRNLEIAHDVRSGLDDD